MCRVDEILERVVADGFSHLVQTTLGVDHQVAHIVLDLLRVVLHHLCAGLNLPILEEASDQDLLKEIGSVIGIIAEGNMIGIETASVSETIVHQEVVDPRLRVYTVPRVDLVRQPFSQLRTPHHPGYRQRRKQSPIRVEMDDPKDPESAVRDHRLSQIMLNHNRSPYRPR
jgi:hypothetical protein